MVTGRVIAPREVFNELVAKDDDLYEWARQRRALFVDPTDDVQRAVGPIYATFPRPGSRDGADPFVIAEAQVRSYSVVTYEGRTFAGPVTPQSGRKMPGICANFGVPCITLPEALGRLGAAFR